MKKKHYEIRYLPYFAGGLSLFAGVIGIIVTNLFYSGPVVKRTGFCSVSVSSRTNCKWQV